MTDLVVNHGIIKSITILSAVIRPMIKFDVDKPRDCLVQEIKWTLAIRYQLSTLSEVGFGPRTPPPTRSATGKRYLLSARRESMNSKRSAADSKRWRL
jgi:hypothetical protein